jgi:hypothetical protein
MQKKPDGTRQKLIALGSGRLVDALLELAARNAEVADLVERMVASPKENVSRFKSKLAALKRRRRFIGWSESSAYARELIDLLGDLKAGVEDPKLGRNWSQPFTKPINPSLNNVTTPTEASGMSSATTHGSCLFITRLNATRRLG